MRIESEAAEIIGRIMVEMEEVFALIHRTAGAGETDPDIEQGADRAAPTDLN